MTNIAKSLYLKKQVLVEQLNRIAADHKSVALANSLSIEDMLITHLLLTHNIAIEIFSLDTGRLHQETLQVIDDVKKQYGYQIEVFSPDADDIEKYVQDNGINGFYDSVEQRKGCCYVRKVLPLKRALSGKEAWITGMRREQGATRNELEEKAWDESNGLWKYNPLADWTEKEVWQLIRSENIPYNALYDQHFASIGCAPCTRSITMGEDVRAGRWWWENPDSKECGLHVQASPIKLISEPPEPIKYDGGDQG
ncbi:phosphoadenylyl-sulfate reductase [Porticoccaceae bacterium LTM1]|nr:phosphoadenylyl-sulfate reductase [Porticoccaceae bacterium LTM1]